MKICETERLILRLQTYEDAQNLVELNSDAEVVRYTGNGPLANAAEAKKASGGSRFPSMAEISDGTTLL